MDDTYTPKLQDLLAQYTEQEQIAIILEARECDDCSDLSEHIQVCLNK